MAIMHKTGWLFYEYLEDSLNCSNLRQGKCSSTGAKKVKDQIVSWSDCRKTRLWGSAFYGSKVAVGTCGTHGEFAGHVAIPNELFGYLEGVALTAYLKKQGDTSCGTVDDALSDLLVYMEKQGLTHTWDDRTA